MSGSSVPLYGHSRHRSAARSLERRAVCRQHRAPSPLRRRLPGDACPPADRPGARRRLRLRRLHREGGRARAAMATWSASSRSRRWSPKPDARAQPQPVVRARAGPGTGARRSASAEPFDVVMSRSVLHWVPARDHRSILEQCRRGAAARRPAAHRVWRRRQRPRCRRVPRRRRRLGRRSACGARAVDVPPRGRVSRPAARRRVRRRRRVRAHGRAATIVRPRQRARLAAQSGRSRRTRSVSIRTSALAFAPPSTSTSTSCAVRTGPTTSRLCASTSASNARVQSLRRSVRERRR